MRLKIKTTIKTLYNYENDVGYHSFECAVVGVDAAGREVLRRELPAGTRRATLEVSGLPVGTYFVTLTTAAGTGTRRLVID